VHYIEQMSTNAATIIPGPGIGIVRAPTTEDKLKILSDDARFDLACACGSSAADRRTKAADHSWVYPVTLPNGGTTRFFKTLLSNVCVNDCAYCPLRANQDPRRVVLQTEEVVHTFMNYVRTKKVFGLFLSSGVVGSPDSTMERINSIARILRIREKFYGYMHLKIIPGASSAAIQEAVMLADSVSINMETTENHFGLLSQKKQYQQDIIRPIKEIAGYLQERNQMMPYAQVPYLKRKAVQTTQFVVGAAGEKDQELIRYMGGLYSKIGMSRIYFSAYQRGFGSAHLPGEQALGANTQDNQKRSLREHRLYQTDFLLRQYGFSAHEIPIDGEGFLSLQEDPKKAWANAHPEYFPLSIAKATKQQLLRVPGLGPTWVSKIIKARQQGPVRNLEQLGKVNARLRQASEYLG
jgi:predicted DNA-binding helix-hairpin-helix protein